MKNFKNSCFVCKKRITPETSTINMVVNMPVCKHCRETKKEKETEKEFLDSLADGFVCGCI